ncbi:hypothetical protein G5V59_26165 [Nocardioides sp. W3-2-3]|uniref:hypothetical protein n=1 Tax=Nocardioides convexus TaxID=2712224 RepID=UPI0024188FB4|nr:hypothetical protein [Nocardioides convexus]NHA01940.1 hypothetical protein [Nocardioides convexus]
MDFHVEGRVLEVDSAGMPAEPSPVVLPALSGGVRACPIHLDLLFREAEERDAALQTASDVLDDLGVRDVVAISMTYAGSSGWVMFPFSVYLVFAEFDDALRDHLRERFPVEAADEPEDGRWWYEQVVQGAIVEAVDVEKSVEISTPDRFKTATEWEIDAVKGYGRFDDSLVWSDDAVLGMVSGFDGRLLDIANSADPSGPKGGVEQACVRISINAFAVPKDGGLLWTRGSMNERPSQRPASSFLCARRATSSTPWNTWHEPESPATCRASSCSRNPTRSSAWSGAGCIGMGRRMWRRSTKLWAPWSADFMDYAFAQASGDLADVDEEPVPPARPYVPSHRVDIIGRL